MKYESGYKEKVDTSIEAAINNVSTAQSTAKGITIPADFERAEELKNNVITGIENFSLNDIKDEIESAIRAYEYIESLNKAFASNLKFDFGKTKDAALGIVEHTKVVIVKKELKDCVNQDTFYYKEWVDPENGKDGIVKNCLTEETKKDIEKLIKSINAEDLKKRGTSIEEIKEQLMLSIYQANKYVYNQEEDLNKLNQKKTDKDIKLEQDNIMEHMNHIVYSSVHVNDEGRLCKYEDGKEVPLTAEDWLNELEKTSEYIHQNSRCRDDEKYTENNMFIPVEGTYCYGNGVAPEAGQEQNSRTGGNEGRVRDQYKNEVDYVHYTSCDRYVSMTINGMGLYDDQNLGGDNICREEYLTSHGFDKVEDYSDLKPGDIIEINGEHSEHHFFVIAEYDKETGLCRKYDYGSYKRFLNEQPNDEVPLIEEEWFKADKTKEVTGVYRIKD